MVERPSYTRHCLFNSRLHAFLNGVESALLRVPELKIARKRLETRQNRSLKPNAKSFGNPSVPQTNERNRAALAIIAKQVWELALFAPPPGCAAQVQGGMCRHHPRWRTASRSNCPPRFPYRWSITRIFEACSGIWIFVNTRACLDDFFLKKCALYSCPITFCLASCIFVGVFGFFFSLFLEFGPPSLLCTIIRCVIDPQSHFAIALACPFACMSPSQQLWPNTPL